MKKRGGLGQFADLRGAWQERGGVVFEGGWYPDAHYAGGAAVKMDFPVGVVQDGWDKSP